MKAIKIDIETKKIYEVEVSDIREINDHLQGAKERAHTFQTGDVLLIDGDGAYNNQPCFKMGSKKFGFKTFFGNGVIIHEFKNSWSSAKKSVFDIKRLVKF